jgi:cytochrome c oxidase cbb3-type subunit 2
MKNGFVFFLGLFGALALSWGGILLANRQLGALAPYYDDTESKSFPDQQPGVAARGQLVYADLGCAACHTQAVRRPDFGSDQARGWGERQSVARDYIFQARVQLGTARLGPDLTNLAGRKPTAPDAEDLLKLLYTGQGAMPAYKFLFDERPIVGEQSAKALKFTGQLAAAPGREIVPTERAQSLVAFLLSLNNPYDYPEARPVPHEAAKKEEGAPALAAPMAPDKTEAVAAPLTGKKTETSAMPDKAGGTTPPVTGKKTETPAAPKPAAKEEGKK